ncbi:hypothetical protein EHV15_35310 [Paenibacillus oralis]|uniref:Uncharacterized protein n=1 Tax=Paenibacillus oralis TaxID=2490856 RepID=A0A3P3TBD9_9BACL|nr:hypothetical protein [Paenibacillus oralis]RRJ54844.1 hypothetical protein EHV15_35310 [Paenibacillus oralis]
MKEIFQYPIHPLANGIMQLTERHAIPNPFFSRQEESVLSLLLYYLEDLFASTFPNDLVAFDVLLQNPRIFQFSLDVFQKAFSEMPETSRAKQVFERTPFMKLTPNWETQERTMFVHTLSGLRKRFQITDETIQEDISRVEGLNPATYGLLEKGNSLLDKDLECNWVCPECKVSSPTEQWNQETAAKWGEDIFPIGDPVSDHAVFVCPNCKFENIGEVILEESKYKARIVEE